MSLTLTALRARIADRFGLSIREELDQVLIALTPRWPGTSFQRLGTGWVSVTSREAMALVPEITRFSLAYKMRVAADWRGDVDPEEFVAQFDNCARFFSNGWPLDWRSRASFGWNGGSTSTFNAGIAAVDADAIGILWVQDED